MSISCLPNTEPKTQTEIHETGIKEIIFLSYYLNVHWFFTLLGEYMQLTVVTGSSICVNYFLSIQ